MVQDLSMINERNIFLTEAMGLCYHNWYIPPVESLQPYICTKCGLKSTKTNIYINFSSWEGFGKLWEWSEKQEWWYKWRDEHGFTYDYDIDYFVHPDRFANEIYKYLS